MTQQQQQQNSSDSPNTADIVEKLLRSKITKWLDFGAEWHFINPDGPEAAAEITELREAFALADSLVCAAIEHGFYVGEGLLDKLASARAALKDHRKAQAHD